MYYSLEGKYYMKLLVQQNSGLRIILIFSVGCWLRQVFETKKEQHFFSVS